MYTYEISTNELRVIAEDIKNSRGTTRQKAEAVVSQLFQQAGIRYEPENGGVNFEGFISQFKATKPGNVSMTSGALEALTWAVKSPEAQDILNRSASTDTGQRFELKLGGRLSM